MKLSEMPEGVKTEARIEGKTEAFQMTVRDGTAYYPSGMRSTVKPSGWIVVEPVEDIATLKARIAELESALAKSTRPAPAVGQVWRAKDDEVYLIAGGGDAHINMYGDCSVLEFGSIAEAGPMKDCTYVGIWDGVFNVKEVRSEQDD